jgi:hypothetical protein
MALVILNDFVIDRRTEIVFNHPQDFQRVEAAWEVDDKFLKSLQHTDQFAGRVKWCHLDPSHIRFLLMNLLNKAGNLTEEELSNKTNEVMVDLTFTIVALIKCIEDSTESTVELMHIERFGEQEVLYKYLASVNMQLSLRPKKGLRVIVDNT